MIEKGTTLPVLDNIGFVRYIDHFGSDERICEAARISYRAPSKGPEQDQKLINYLWKHHHTSPFEQVNITFNIKLPLFVQGQLVRHRTQRLNQVSARYTEMSEEFYIPTKWRKQDVKNKQSSVNDQDWDITKSELGDISINDVNTQLLEQHCEDSYKLYQQYIKNGVAREMARMLLPQNLYTEIYSNWDLNNLMKLFSLRLDEHAQLEIREYAKAMYNITKEIYPMTIKAYDRYKMKVIDLEENT